MRISGTGSFLPEDRLTNGDLERLMETSDEWIVQRTGIRERRRARLREGETVTPLAARALSRALEAAGVRASSLDLVICATMTPEMDTPASACRIANLVGAGHAGAFDLNAACSGFVFALTVAHDLIKCGSHARIGVVGADTLTRAMDYSSAGRATAILFGDGAGAAILEACDNPSLGVIAHAMHADGGAWADIFIPRVPTDFPDDLPPDPARCGVVQMNGSSVYKFAVSTFPRLIENTLDKAGLSPDDIDFYVCHQSNARILAAAQQRFNIPDSKFYINIDRYGNTVSASVPICLDELTRAGRIRPGMRVMFLGFGAGLTWGSCLWQT
ncbi:MAG: beta-ketoacyl-ACP synthase III [Planctomycetota bacterium]|nr:beta-ketoacyl-ACP synthase III [Planctomycetota bacterium]